MDGVPRLSHRDGGVSGEDPVVVPDVHVPETTPKFRGMTLRHTLTWSSVNGDVNDRGLVESLGLPDSFHYRSVGPPTFITFSLGIH